MIGYTKMIMNRTANPGDRISDRPQTIEEKAQQLAVDAPDITGEHLKVPAYFIVEYPNGQKKALHHVRDANEISDVIRQARFEEENSSEYSDHNQHFVNFSGIALVLALSLLTSIVLIGIF